MYISTKPFPRDRRPASAQPPLIDHCFAPDLFATGIAGLACIGDGIHLTLDSLRCDHSQPTPVMERLVVGRIILPIATAQALVTSLNLFLEQQGMSPSKAAAAGASFQ